LTGRSNGGGSGASRAPFPGAVPDPVVLDMREGDLRLAEARRLAAQACVGLHPDVADDVALCVSELVTNAHRHGRGPVQLRITRGPARVHVAVDDHDTRHPHLRVAHDDGGRGLAIVAAISTRWGTDPQPWGKTVWADIPAGP
jgi:hypothetical protein